MCKNPKVELAKKKKKLRGLKNEIAKTGNNLCRVIKKERFDLEEVQKTTIKLYQLTEDADRLEKEIFILEQALQKAQELSPA